MMYSATTVARSEKLMAQRNGSAQWRGDLQSGSGTVTVGSGVFEGAYSFDSRFGAGEGGGTNPEQLIAAAHAACFSMALSAGLEKAGTPASRIETQARCTIDTVDGAPKITTIALSVRGDVPRLDQAGFQKAAEAAKTGCPVSKALQGNVTIRLEAKLG